jgi:hypothetical protein
MDSSLILSNMQNLAINELGASDGANLIKPQTSLFK